ncbi:PEP-CTERM sorting domain-containing protein [Pannus brasiliensis CCIBt3594]|uniref:PEP-CTERM sorting domain-containing protein n=1 Tax=Pannus brasiliensis CCIBt3594 TaxID=1427578 RepID=A0AAW9QWS2_9CHRO
MNKVLNRLTVTTLATTALYGAIAWSTNNPARGSTFNYSFQTNTGYTGTGSFSYPAGSPSVISENGSGPTNFLQSLSLSVFAPDNTLLGSANSVVNGVSSNNFLRFDFNSLTETLFVYDNSTAASGNDPYYFISNVVDTNGNPLPSGTIDANFNLFSFSSTTGTTFLGSTPSIQVIPVSSVPEPASALALLTLGALGAGSLLKKR